MIRCIISFLLLGLSNLLLAQSTLGLNEFEPEDVSTWITYQNDFFGCKLPSQPEIYDTLNLNFGALLANDSTLELSFYVLDSAFYQFQNEFSGEAGILEQDPFNIAYAKTLMMSSTESSLEIVSLNPIVILLPTGIDKNTFEGFEVVTREDVGTHMVLQIQRVFQYQKKILIFSVSGDERLVFPISDYRTNYFNSIKLQ